MATKRQPAGQPSVNHRGVWRIDRPGRPQPFGVQWRERVWDDATGREIVRRPAEFYADEADREKRLIEKAAEKSRGQSVHITREELRQWEAFKTATGGVAWQEIFAGYQNWIAHTGAKACTVSVKDYAETYLAEAKTKVKHQEMSADSFRHKERIIGDLAASFGHVMLDQIRTSDVEKWVAGFGHGSAFTVNSYRKILFAFFNRAVQRRIVRHNPISDLERRRTAIDNRDKILTPAEAAHLFETARTRERFHEIINRLALEAFLGLRFTSAFRLAAHEVNRAERTILLPAYKLKTGMESGAAHQIDTNEQRGLDNLWAWLALRPDAGWALEPRQYLELKSQLFAVADVIHPRNTLRKSFCSYDLAVHRNPGRTAYLLGHTDQDELWAYYKGNASAADGKLYQSITPQTAAEIAAGVRRPFQSQPRKAPGPQDG